MARNEKFTFTEEEKLFIRENCDKMLDKHLAEEISKMRGYEISLDRLKKERRKMGLLKKAGRGRIELVDENLDDNNGNGPFWEYK